MAKKMKKARVKEATEKKSMDISEEAIRSSRIANRAFRDWIRKKGIKAKTVYSVEKFLPIECPRCKHKFLRQNSDWQLLLGDIVDGHKVVRKTRGYDIIICSHCGNYTARFPLESYSISDIKVARKLLKKGFVNLQKGTTFGMMRDFHTVAGTAPKVNIIGVKAEPKKKK